MKFKSFHWLSHHGLWAIIPYACARRRPVQPEVYLHILTFRLLTNIEAVLAVMNITELVVEYGLKTIQARMGFEPMVVGNGFKSRTGEINLYFGVF